MAKLSKKNTKGKANRTSKVLKKSTQTKLVAKGVTKKTEKEILKLRETLQRRTIELEEKNRELKIESSLERVRAQAMSMKKPADLLDICENLFIELQALGFSELRNTMINIHNDEQASFLNYDYSDLAGKTITNISYDSLPAVAESVNKIRKSKDAFASFSVKGKELNRWKKFRRKNGEQDDPRIEKSKGIHYYFYSIGIGAIGISTFEPIGEERLELLKRFRNVFNLSYQRYMDIATAEAQAREAQIQLALEKVRARAMAMHRSDELAETSALLAKQFSELGQTAEQISIGIVKEKDEIIEMWINMMKNPLNKLYRVSIHEPSVLQKIYRGWKEKKKSLIIDLKGKELLKYVRFRETLGGASINEDLISGRRVVHTAYFTEGIITLSAKELCPPETIQLLERFAGVFDLTYTRFLDLQKAEAQAREAQIEAALERVRSRTVGMQKSEELRAVIEVIYEQFVLLGFEIDNMGFLMDFSDNDDYNVWGADRYGVLPDKMHVPFFDHPFNWEYIHHRNSELELFTKTYPFEEKNLWWKGIFKNITGLPEEIKETLLDLRLSSPALAVSRVLLKHSGIYLFNFSGQPYSDEQNAIIIRFTKAFEQTYTRFLDLQKAEAQARESQIQLALERVRARTMAMQRSEELAETVTVMFEQFKSLGEAPERMAIEIVNEQEHVFEIWATRHGGSQLDLLLKASLNEPHVMQKMYSAWKSKTKSITIDLQGNALEEYFQFLKKRGLPVERKIFGKRRVQNVATFSKGILTIITPEPRPQGTIDILERFALVFDSTYTRFLDLQKAEAQAREALIEASLERVRSRSMAMHRSDELKEAGELLWNELGKLGIESLSSGYVLIDEEKKIGWTYAPNPATGKIGEPLGIVHSDTKEMNTVFTIWKKQEPLSVIEMDERETIAHQTFVAERAFSFDGKISNWITAQQLIALSPKRLFLHCFNFKEGYLLIVGGNRLNEEQKTLMLRFTKVFQQTYTRFLDLQKAEAQAREAQIQLALERVRARTMAMQSSEELAEVSFLLNKQVVELGISTRGCAFNIYGENESTEWFSNLEGTLPAYKTPREKIFLKYYEAGQRGETLLIEEFDKERIKQHYDYLHSLHLLGHDEDVVEKIRNAMPDSQVDHVAYFKYGYLLFITLAPAPEAHDVFKRFAKEFEQTYTRFLDLQKAEAQAREAKIEAALERVRAKAMAMHKTDELKEVVDGIFAGLLQLGYDPSVCGISLLDHQTKASNNWASMPTENGSSSYNYSLPYFDHPLINKIFQYHKENKPSFIYHLKGKDLVDYTDHFFSSVQIPELESLARSIKEIYANAIFMSHGAIMTLAPAPMVEGEISLMQRFSKVVDLCYTRFLDLQKAEQQTREAEIELAVERVRANALAMHKSADISSLANTFRQELIGLKIPAITAVTICLKHNHDKIRLWDITSRIEKSGDEYHFNMDFVCDLVGTESHDWIRRVWDTNEKYFVFEEDEEFLKRTIAWLRKYFVQYADNAEQYYSEHNIKQVWHPVVSLEYGRLSLDMIQMPLPEVEPILVKMGAAFDLAYKRFLDLQKAEAQARESQIQLALERVRARTMAMQRSDELPGTAALLFDEFKKLVSQELIQATIGKYDEEKNEIEFHATHWEGGGVEVERPAYGSMDEPSLLKPAVAAWRAKAKSLVVELTGDRLQQWVDYRNKMTGTTISANDTNGNRVISIGFFSKGHLSLSSPSRLPEETIKILERFAEAFDLTYTRFLDLQKAEEQAREAEIQLSLERVRARSLAMHSTSELVDVVGSVFEQLTHLGFDLDGSAIVINLFDDNSNDITQWIVDTDHKFPYSFHHPYFDNEILNDIRNARLNGVSYFSNVYSFEEKNKFWNHYFEHTDFKRFPDELKQIILAKESYAQSMALEKHSGILNPNINGKVLDAAQREILERFAKVFEQSYIRFLDLQKAESQAREAQIETALERVRAVAMAMHKPEEMLDMCKVIANELQKLNIEKVKLVETLVFYPEKEILLDYEHYPISNHTCISTIEYKKHPAILDMANKMLSSNEGFYHNRLTGQELKEWIAYMQSINLYVEPQLLVEDELNYYFHSIGSAALGLVTFRMLNDEEIGLFKRLRNVFELAYTRYVDIERALAQAREAQIEAALEKVRSRTLAMQKSDELAETSAVLFKQLIGLGISPNRLYITLIKDENGDAEFWITDEDGSKVSMAYEDNMNSNASFKKMFDGWKAKKQSMIIDMQGEELKNYFQHLTQLNVPFKGGLEQKRRVQHLAYFSKGFIGMASPDEQPVETMQLLERFAYVFNLTFTRFHDLQMAEAHALQAEQDLIEIKAARKKAEDALTELQATQKQLIQSEKMASLGELTAGIAHEIQNPLNFVNNFSEVSNELMAELKTELATGNRELATEIANDIAGNLEKINHHGKRAADIVKGMLQHSRTSSGQKELTDINALCDEYLRLAYHGLRAKDKSFNAKFETDFDSSIPKINVIPQDIGRVILNLINNAFYAVNEKAKLQAAGFESLVKVTTKKLEDKIVIRVADNGNGIPNSIKEKIFQPFFTTKPTGQGTGLGLSLAYDIVTKGHGGELKVETKEGEGSIFVILLNS
jgi:signal transduction histidine kinase